jgi:hypothetical protein
LQASAAFLDRGFSRVAFFRFLQHGVHVNNYVKVLGVSHSGSFSFNRLRALVVKVLGDITWLFFSLQEDA